MTSLSAGAIQNWCHDVLVELTFVSPLATFLFLYASRELPIDVRSLSRPASLDEFGMTRFFVSTKSVHGCRKFLLSECCGQPNLIERGDLGSAGDVASLINYDVHYTDLNSSNCRFSCLNQAM